MENLTEDEKRLIRYYRQMDDRGRNRVMFTAQSEYEESKIIHLDTNALKK